MTKKRPKQERGNLTRQKLIRAAVDSLSESNVYSLRFSQIAKRAGVPQALMDYHFPSQEALLRDMVDQELEKFLVMVIEAIEKNVAHPRRALDAYIRVVFDLAEKDEGFRAVWSAYYHLTSVSKPFADLNRHVRKLGHERILTLLKAVLQSENRQNRTRGKTLNEVATAIQGLITGYGFMAASETGGDFSALADLAVRAAFQLMEANFPRP